MVKVGDRESFERTFTKEEESNMKSNLDLLLKEEDVDEDRDITDEV